MGNPYPKDAKDRKMMNKSDTIYAKLGICPAREGTICQCGRCTRKIEMIAKKRDMSPEAFLDLLGLKPAIVVPTRTYRPVSHGRVAERMTVSTRGGSQATGVHAVVVALTALSEGIKKK
jgi:hypothetical protein